MTKQIPGDGFINPKYYIIGAIVLIVFLLCLKSGPDQQVHSFLRVNSPDRTHIAKVYITTVDKMEGYFLSVSVFNNKENLLRKDFYRQWNCGNVAISWKTDDELIINGITMNWLSDTIEFGVNGGNEFCPVRSIVY